MGFHGALYDTSLEHLQRATELQRLLWAVLSVSFRSAENDMNCAPPLQELLPGIWIQLDSATVRSPLFTTIFCGRNDSHGFGAWDLTFCGHDEQSRFCALSRAAVGYGFFVLYINYLSVLSSVACWRCSRATYMHVFLAGAGGLRRTAPGGVAVLLVAEERPANAIHPARLHRCGGVP